VQKHPIYEVKEITPSSDRKTRAKPKRKFEKVPSTKYPKIGWISLRRITMSDTPKKK